jgi:hypothetical protein
MLNVSEFFLFIFYPGNFGGGEFGAKFASKFKNSKTSKS